MMLVWILFTALYAWAVWRAPAWSDALWAWYAKQTCTMYHAWLMVCPAVVHVSLVYVLLLSENVWLVRVCVAAQGLFQLLYANVNVHQSEVLQLYALQRVLLLALCSGVAGVRETALACTFFFDACAFGWVNASRALWVGLRCAERAVRNLGAHQLVGVWAQVLGLKEKMREKTEKHDPLQRARWYLSAGALLQLGLFETPLVSVYLALVVAPLVYMEFTRSAHPVLTPPKITVKPAAPFQAFVSPHGEPKSVPPPTPIVAITPEDAAVADEVL